jgi:hypothetical protein
MTEADAIRSEVIHELGSMREAGRRPVLLYLCKMSPLWACVRAEGQWIDELGCFQWNGVRVRPVGPSGWYVSSVHD